MEKTVAKNGQELAVKMMDLLPRFASNLLSE
jgi:hypothetical protein